MSVGEKNAKTLVEINFFFFCPDLFPRSLFIFIQTIFALREKMTDRVYTKLLANILTIKIHLHWRNLPRYRAFLTFLGHLGWRDIKGPILSVSCCARWPIQVRSCDCRVSLTVSLTNFANVNDPLKAHLHWQSSSQKPHKTALEISLTVLAPNLGDVTKIRIDSICVASPVVSKASNSHS
jgi:hypothetical protein